ncbi:MAG: oligopeptidase A, partial [Gammaproteobacteria bacterium]|nr:oligopeptidase A [Gammaproteobacteria bacterium]
MNNNNPLLIQSALPHFSSIHAEDIEPALKIILEKNRTTLGSLLKENQVYTWDNLLFPLEEMDDKLSQMWSSVSHLHSVKESEPLRAAYNACLPLLTEYHTELSQNETLYRAIQSIAEGPEYQTLNPAQRKIIDNNLRDFRLSGVNLSPEKKLQYAELVKKLSNLSTQFSENILDATQAWTLHIINADDLKGLPEPAIKIALQNAEERKLQGWVFTLDYASYASVMKYLANRELRRLIYEAFVTRASDQGPNAGQFDNTVIMEEIIKCRHELAYLLGFNNFAEYSLATKMADTPTRVLDFLYNLVDKSQFTAKKEIEEVSECAKRLDGILNLEAWDLAYYTEKLRLEKYALSDEELRTYFPANQVFTGMFNVVGKLYGLKIIERSGI